MAVFERIREFGLVKALGMKPLRIVGQVLSESLMLLLLGSAAGVVLGVLTVLALSGGIDLSAVAAGAEYAGISRIIFPQLVFRDVTGSILVVCLLGCLVSLYPAIKAARITPVEAMAHN
jgi:ABC-type antimicrobial peptide transport system permease subunit